MNGNPNAPAVDTVELGPIVDELCCGVGGTTFGAAGKVTLPSREVVIQIVEDLRSVFFPGYFGTTDVREESLHFFLGATLERTMGALEEQVRRAFAFFFVTFLLLAGTIRASAAPRGVPAAICGRWSMGTTLALGTPWMST